MYIVYVCGIVSFPFCRRQFASFSIHVTIFCSQRFSVVRWQLYVENYYFLPSFVCAQTGHTSSLQALQQMLSPGKIRFGIESVSKSTETVEWGVNCKFCMWHSALQWNDILWPKASILHCRNLYQRFQWWIANSLSASTFRYGIAIREREKKKISTTEPNYQ